MPTKLRAITNPQATIDMLERAISETRDSNRVLREAVELLHAAIFGRPDADPSRSLPGLQNSVSDMQSQIVGVAAQLVSAEKQLGATTREVYRLRWWITGGMAAAMIVLSLVDLFVRTQMHAIGAF